MFKEISRGHAWRDAWRGGVGTLAVRGHPTVSDSLAASLGSDSARDVHKMGGETIPVLMAQ
jgi:hypothetical protein